MAGFIEGVDRGQLWLLLRASIGGSRMAISFASSMRSSSSLISTGWAFKMAEPADLGRPGYNPALHLKLYIYGYLNRIQSSRRLERHGEG
jgi:hypothetical protein